MLFQSARSILLAAESELERKDARDCWKSDEEIEASVLCICDAEDAVARAPASCASDVAFKLRYAIGLLDEAEATGTLENRLRIMLRGALADLDRGGSAALA